MEKESKTETEEIIVNLIKDDEEKSKESDKRDEKDEEQTQADEGKDGQDEGEQIDEYKRKIDELDAQLNEYKSKAINNRKRMALIKAGYTEEQAERYTSFIEGETIEEIRRSVAELINDIPVKDNFADPSPMNHAKQKPAPADPGEVGKTLFERIKHRIWGGGATS